MLRLVAGGGAETAGHSTAQSADPPAAEALGVNIHAKQLVDGRDKQQLERLCRYLLRPSLSQERLEQREDGRLQLTLKSAWKDGTRALVLEPHDLLVRLCAAIPLPWFNRVRYFGVLSSHSKDRAEVVPKSALPGRSQPEPAIGDQLSLEAWCNEVVQRASLSQDAPEPAEPRRQRSRWAWLLKRVFRADVDTCSRCGGSMRWTEVATEQDAIARLLAKHGLAPQPPPKPTRHGVPFGQLGLPFGK